MKVQVWQVGYATRKDWKERVNPICRKMGYVVVPDYMELWEEQVWNLLNWSCWNYDDKGNVSKPREVHSPLSYCNSDIILKAENSNEYKYAKFVGFGETTSFEEAVAILTARPYTLSPFYDAK